MECNAFTNQETPFYDPSNLSTFFDTRYMTYNNVFVLEGTTGWDSLPRFIKGYDKTTDMYYCSRIINNNVTTIGTVSCMGDISIVGYNFFQYGKYTGGINPVITYESDLRSIPIINISPYLKSMNNNYCVKSIDPYAFYNQYVITNVNLSRTYISTIGAYAFHHCCISSIKLPSTLLQVDENAFTNQYDFKTTKNTLVSILLESPLFLMPAELPVFDMSVLKQIFVLSGNGWNSPYFLNTMVPIITATYNDRPFVCSNPTSTSDIVYIGDVVTVGGSISLLGWNATVPSLNNLPIIFPLFMIDPLRDKIYTIDSIQPGTSSQGTFQNIPYKQVDLSNTMIRIIPDYAFYNANITSVILPANLAIIGKYAFSGNNLGNALSSLENYNLLTTIDTSAFQNAGITGNIVFPISLGKLNTGAFQSIPNTNGVVNTISSVDFSNTSITTINDYTFNNNYTIQHIEFPINSLVSIEQYAFNNAFNNNTLVLPNPILSIKANAFSNNESLDTVIFPASILYLYNNAFIHCNISFCLFLGQQPQKGRPEDIIFDPLLTYINRLPDNTEWFNKWSDNQFIVPLDEYNLILRNISELTISDSTTLPGDTTLFDGQFYIDQDHTIRLFYDKNNIVLDDYTTNILATDHQQFADYQFMFGTYRNRNCYGFSDGGTNIINDPSLNILIPGAMEWNFTHTGLNYTTDNINWNSFPNCKCIFYYKNMNPLITTDSCFPANTPVETDQGTIKIQNIDRNYHTIGGKKIVGVVSSYSIEPFFVHFQAGSLGNNLPTQSTTMSQRHRVLYKDEMRLAVSFIEEDHCGVDRVKNNGSIIYNILMEKHETMCVNGLIVETMHPDNHLSKIYRDVIINDTLTDIEKNGLIDDANKAFLARKRKQTRV